MKNSAVWSIESSLNNKIKSVVPFGIHDCDLYPWMLFICVNINSVLAHSLIINSYETMYQTTWQGNHKSGEGEACEVLSLFYDKGVHICDVWLHRGCYEGDKWASLKQSGKHCTGMPDTSSGTSRAYLLVYCVK